MGNHLCSICSNQTNITEIKQLSLNYINNNKNKLNNRNTKLLNSSPLSSYVSSSLSLNQEINYSKQSLYDFNNLIYLVDKDTNNIIKNHIKNRTKIQEKINDLFFINTYKDYQTLKVKDIYPLKDVNFEEIGIPKEIYKDKGLNYMQRKNYIEVLFIKEKKMIKIFNNLENQKCENINIRNHINNINNIKCFFRDNQIDSKKNSVNNYSFINNNEKNKNINSNTSNNNTNSKTLDPNSPLNTREKNIEIETDRQSPSILIFRILLLLVIEEDKIRNSLENKIDIDNYIEYHLINNDWLDKYKKAYNYSKVNKIFKDNLNKELNENDILTLIKNNSNLIEDISETIKEEKTTSELKDINKLIYYEYHKGYKVNNLLNKISIPHNFSFITPKILQLILKLNNFKCENKFNIKKNKCVCPFCEGNFLKKYKCFIGNETILISHNDNKNEYFAIGINIDKYKNNKFKIDYLLLFENNDILNDEMKNYFCKNNINDYLKIRNINKGIIKQNILNKDGDVIGRIININLLLAIKKKVIYRNYSVRNFKNYENILTSKTFKKNLPRNITVKFEPLLGYKKPALIGLNKTGSPFFFNPILQCLSNISELTNYFLFNYNFFTNKNNKAKYPFCYHYANLIAELWKKPSDEDSEANNYPYYKKSFLPFQIKEYISKINNFVLIQQKNEFRELFLFIIKLLDTELNIFDKDEVDNDIRSISSCTNKVSNSTEDEEKIFKRFREDYQNKFNSIIQKNFYSEIQVSYQCLDCNLYKYHYEIVNSFTFDLEIIKKNYLLKYKFKEIMNKVLVFSIDDCFENQERPSILEQNILCQKCNLRTLQKQIRIIKSPNILVLFFKEKEISKIQFKISLDFQLNPFIHDIFANKSESGKNIPFKKNSYDLICILCSPVNKERKGEYLAYCKSPINNWWYCYNDSIVTSVDEQALREIKIPKLLIYKRKEMVTLIFLINKDQKLEVEVDFDMIFRNVVSYLYVKYSWLKKTTISYFLYNDKKIDLNKKVSQNNLTNGSVIICKQRLFL